MLSPSDEQMNIINAIKEGYNVQVDAVAGSGKTTTVLSLAHYICEKNILQVTYNSELKLEVRQKQIKYAKEYDMQLDNLSIYTYHALGFKYYTELAKTDIGLNKILEENMAPKKKLPKIDIIVIDEIQDMNELYFRFIIKFLRDVCAGADTDTETGNGFVHTPSTSSTEYNQKTSACKQASVFLHFAGEGASITDNQFITSFSQLLMNNIHAKVAYRCSASQTLELFEEVLYSIDARTIASIV